MFTNKPHCNYAKLKSNLRLCATRLQNLQKKKTELNVRARRDLADYIKQNKIDRARIRVQLIVKDDYLIEVYDILETFCDLLISRMGLIESMNEIDPGLMDAIATMLWISPRLLSDLPELKAISKELTSKYGKPFAEACTSNSSTDVNPKVKQKMSVRAPPDNLCEAYLVEIARSYDVEFTPDKHLLNNDSPAKVDLGAPPLLPEMDIFSSDYENFENNLDNPENAPYPSNEYDSHSVLPHLPDEKHDDYSTQPYESENTEKSVRPNLPVGPPAGFNSNPPPSKHTNKPPVDSEDLDDLSARFDKLKHG